jgi:glycosyltransferase involved in cell wall biosynthesis
VNKNTNKHRIIIFTQTPCNPPLGADARRARCIAMALASMKWYVTIYHLRFGPRPVQNNNNIEYGVTFHYPSLYIPIMNKNNFTKVIFKGVSFVRFIIELLIIMIFKRYAVALICHNSFNQVKFLVSLSNIFNLPVIKELCEWYPGISSYPKPHRFYSGPLYRKIDGLISISDYISKKVQEILINNNINLSYILKIPILYEKEISYNIPIKRNQRYFLWCGMVDGYIDLVLFMIQAFSLAIKLESDDIKLKIFGKYNQHTKERIMQFARSCCVENKIMLMGFVDDDILSNEIQGAIALLLPLLDDIQSRARFPTKLAEYLISGIPVIATEIGELKSYLKHMESAILSPPGDYHEFSKGLRFVLEKPFNAHIIGIKGRAIARDNFYFKMHAKSLSDFFDMIISY